MMQPCARVRQQTQQSKGALWHVSSDKQLLERAIERFEADPGMQWLLTSEYYYDICRTLCDLILVK